MDRRKTERRQGDRRKASARRPSVMPSLTPGQENAQGHSPAVRAAESYLRRERPLRGPEQMPVEDARESGAPMSRAEVSGPSFLGLAGGSSGSSDYLLEDEPSGGWRKWAVLLVLILLGVLAYMQWKTNWRAQPSSPPPAPVAPSQSGAPQGSAAPASEATGVPAQGSQQAAKQPDTSPQPPAKDAAASPSPEKPDSEGSSGQDPAGDKAAANRKDAAKPADKKDAAADDQSDQPEEEAPAKPEPKPTSHARKPAADRSSTTADAQRDPMLLMAQRYLYGQGVRRDCDQAMVYLRAANQKASAPARSQMGALYATGFCVPLDRIRAYQWFTSALNVEPGNPALQRERNNLWTQMSSDERQQAVK